MNPTYLNSIHHDGSARYVHLSKDGKKGIGSQVTLRLRAAPDAPIERILLRTCPDGEQNFREMEGQALTEGAACRWWEINLTLTMPIVAYRFLLLTADGPWWFNGNGLQRHTPTDAADFRLLSTYNAPAWLRDCTFYQIFPDRFAQGNPNLSVKSDEYRYRGHPTIARAWGEPVTEHGMTAMVEFFGGDLVGVAQRLDYLADLGINAIYLNPIFRAPSNHRYDVTDYKAVDPHLGGNEALIALRQASEARNIHLILDIVPNHCGWQHPWFQSALTDPNAPSADYFTFHNHPDEYECWLGVRSLPKLNYHSQALRKVMYGDSDAILRYWLQTPYNLDGWRIDVANMLGQQGENQLGMEIARSIRQAVKAENPEAYLLGEHFFDGSAQLQGDCWDATMNYSGFTNPLWHWLGGYEVNQFGWPEPIKIDDMPWPTEAMVKTWQSYRAAIPWGIAQQQFNLISSHDTQRISNRVKHNPALLRVAVAILMTYPGVPSIYYGDEIALENSRGCMPWEAEALDNPLRHFYQTLIHLRRNSLALIEGGFQILLIEENTVAYMRDSETEQLIIIAHRGPTTRPAKPLNVSQAAIPNGTVFVELFSKQQVTVSGGQLPLHSLLPGVEIWQNMV